MNNITVNQIVLLSDREIAFEIRRKVFVEEQKVPLEEEYDEFEEISLHFLAYLGKTSAGSARLRITQEGTKLERFCVLMEFRGLGLGSSLVTNLLTICKNAGYNKVYLYAQVSAKKFYEKFGFKAEGDIFLEAGIKHIKMNLEEKG